jgi:NADPH-dependent curcumin reductase CurA
MVELNREWILARRPSGVATDDDFELRVTPFELPDLPPGHIVVRNSVFLCAPTMRNWMERVRVDMPWNVAGGLL